MSWVRFLSKASTVLGVGGNPHFWQKQPEMGHPASEGFISMEARGNKKRGLHRPRFFFTLYFYFSNFAGVNRKGSGKYIRDYPLDIPTLVW
jgi:hypothetical protein